MAVAKNYPSVEYLLYGHCSAKKNYLPDESSAASSLYCLFLLLFMAAAV